MPNPATQEMIQKATIITDAIATYGKLNPEQANQFIDYVMDETSIKDLGCRQVRFTNEKMYIEKINVANRVAVPADEAADPGIRRGVSTSRVELAPKEIMVPFEIGDLFKDYNVEGGKVEDHIARMMATRFANNVEELHFNGNTTKPATLESDYVEGGSTVLYRTDDYLGLYHGWLKQAESGHVVDAENGALTPQLISKALRSMPTKFRKNRKLLKAMVSWDHEQNYREGIASRATVGGDAALEGRTNIPAFGVELFPVALLEPEPQYVENVVMNTDGSTPSSLSYAPVTDVVVTPTTLGKNPAAAYVEDTDYSVDYAAGTVTRLTTIGSGATVKVTYRTAGRALITMPQNMILAIGLDITVGKDRNIYTRVNEYAMHARVYCAFEETDAVVLIKNIKVPS